MSENKGFTLIEVIVASFILGIISIAVFGFMTTGARTYNSVNSTINLQYDTQLTMAQIEEQLMDCGEELHWNPTEMTLLIVNEDTQHIFAMIEDEIYYGSKDSVDTLLDKSDAKDLLVRNVLRFNINISSFEELDRASAVEITLELSDGDKSLLTTQIVATRNEPLVISYL